MRPLDHVADYYTAKLDVHGPTPAGVDWRDQSSQELRFSELAKVTRGANSGSVVDVGCGWGGFALWAARQGNHFDYLGYDVSEAMLDAARSAVPTARFSLGSSNFEPADWVIASGIFNVRLDSPDKEWREHVDATIDEMAKAARFGFAFNCLTGFSDEDRKVSRLYYPYPGEMLDAVMRRHGRHAALQHNTGLYEFTILSWRHPS